MIQAVARRLETPRGGLFYDEEYGTDLRAYVNSNAGPLEIARAAELEAMKDERVLAADATVNRSGQSITVTMKLTLADGPFDLTLDVSDLTVDLITFNAAA